MAESYKPPEAVASNARKGLEMRKRVKAGTDVGVARARDLSNRTPVSLETIGRMVSYFARHGAQRPDDEGTEANPTPWLVAWMLWGGDAGRRWANGIWRREGRAESSRGLSREWARMDAPDGVRLVNPKGLAVGSPFRSLTAGEYVRSERTGEPLGLLSADDLREMVRVFYAQSDRGEGAPRINYNHGPSRGGHPDIYGEAVGLFVADDGERGLGLYVIPGWTEYGADFVGKHVTPDGGSVLSNSPEFVLGPVFARGGGEADDDAELLGSAVFLGVALTPTPQQSESIIDPVRLSRGADVTAPGPEEYGMDPEQRPDDGGMSEMESLKAAHQGLVERLDSLAEMVKALAEKAEAKAEGAEEADEMACGEPKAEMSAEAADALALSVRQAEDGLTGEQRAELSRRVTEADAKALAGEDMGARVVALSRKLALVEQVRGEDRVTALSRRVEEQGKDLIAAKVELKRHELRAMGASAERVERAVKLYARKLAAPQAWAQVHGDDVCPFEAAVADIKARPDVEFGRTGVSAEPANDEAHTMAAVSAWAREQKVEGGALAQAKAYAKAKGIKLEEIV